MGSLAPGGYAWVFPKGDKLANVGLGVTGPINGAGLIDHLNEFVLQRFPGGQQLALVMGSCPCSDELRTTIRNGLMLVGDAAHHCDPLTGGGITNAMEGGKIAGDVAKIAVQKRDFSVQVLRQYEDRRRESLFGKLQHHNFKIKQFALKLSDSEINKLIQSLKGIKPQEMGFASIAMRLVATNPKCVLIMHNLARLKDLVDTLVKNDRGI